MNTEINLLENERKKYTVPLIFGSIFLVLLIIAGSILLFQKNHYSSILEGEKDKLAQMEVELLNHQQVIVSENRRQQLLEAIQSIQNHKLPVVALHEDIISLLPPKSQMVAYQFSAENELEVEASFPTIHEASQFVTQVIEKPYSADVDMTYLNQIESSYQVSFIIKLNTENLIEELGKRD